MLGSKAAFHIQTIAEDIEWKFLQSIAISYRNPYPFAFSAAAVIQMCFPPFLPSPLSQWAQKPELLRNKFADQRTAKVTERVEEISLLSFSF